MRTVAGLPPLRPYQREVAATVLESVRQRKGLSFSVEIARQGGKNEVSARIELLVLLRCRRLAVTSIKAAPTFKPQALISLRRLWRLTQRSGLGAIREGGNCVRLGGARQLFLSADPSSNVVGHTADLLLEVDEAQDVDVDKFDKELQPMAAASGATTVFYGTAWDDANLLERARQAHLAAERRDGIRRHFEYDWAVVAESNPRYGIYVRGEQERLGAEHPMFVTQYCLRTLPGSGRLLGPNQLTLLRGAHPALEGPVMGETYVAGLDVAGAAQLGDTSQDGKRDATVLTVARVVPAAEAQDEAGLEVVRQYAWTGVGHAALQRTLVALLGEWRVARLVVDATGIGEPVAAFLARSLGTSRVKPLKLTVPSKSALGYDLLAAVNGGRLRLPAADSPQLRECWRQLEACRASYRPNQTLSFYVDQRDGHDDCVISLALTLAAAKDSGPRAARGRVRE